MSRWFVIFLCFAVMLLPGLAQESDDDGMLPMVSINNMIFRLDGESLKPMEACAPQSDHVISSGLGRSASGEVLAYLTQSGGRTFINVCLPGGNNPDPVALAGATRPMFSPEGDTFALTYLTEADEGVLAVLDPWTLTEQVMISPIALSDEVTVLPALWLPDGRLVTRSSTFDIFDSTQVEVVYIYEDGRLVLALQFSKVATDRAVELFITGDSLTALMASSELIGMGAGATSVMPQLPGTLTAMSEGVSLTLTTERSIRRGTQRVWSVVHAGGEVMPLDFAGTSSQIAVSPSGDALIYVNEDAVYRWQDGEAVAISGTEITDDTAVTSVVWGRLAWGIETE